MTVSTALTRSEIALRDRIHAMETRVAAASKADFVAPMLYVSLNAALGDSLRTVTTLEGLRSRRPRVEYAEARLAILAFDGLAQLQRDDLLAAYADEILKYDLGVLADDMNHPWMQATAEMTGDRGSRLYFALLENGERGHAKIFADRLLAGCKGPRTFALLHEYANKANQAGEAEQIALQAKGSLNPAELAEFARLIHAEPSTPGAATP